MKNTFQFLLLFLSFNLFAQSPNFVFILADDMGWNGTSLQISPTIPGSMSDFYETPKLVQLASEGMTFSQAYSPAPNCSPTRNSILTGEVPARNSFTTVGNGVSSDRILISGTNNNSIDPADITIAEWLNSTNLNYRTAHYGKWHLGSGGPASNGFSHDDGNNTNTEGDAADGQIIQTDPKKMMDLTNKGIAFMQEAVAANEPFYLQLSHYAVHTLVETTQAAQDYFTAKPSGTIHNNIDYAGMTRDFDDAIGVLLEEITNLGITENTYVIFMSDNGAQANQSSNSPLYRSKGSIYEGGIRVPMIVRGPDILANSTNSEPVVGYDLFPTIADWTGSSAVLPSTLDGTSIKNLTLQTTFNREEPIYFHYPHYGNGSIGPASVATMGNYKLIVNYETGVDNLFDLSANIRDVVANDIAPTNSTITLDLKIQLRDHLKEVNANMPRLDPTHANFSGTAPDVDSDTLEDEWEFRELLSYHYGPTDDPDGDGMDNLTEYNNGTDPLINEMVAIDNIIDANKSSFIALFPNPTQGIINLEFDPASTMNAMIEVQIYNAKGQLVQTFKDQKSDFLSFSLTDIAKGIYTVKILEDGRLSAIEKVVLMKQ